MFKVSHTADVRAIGTQFNICDRPEGTIVSVLEGRVQVISMLHKHTAPKNLAAGKEAQAPSNGDIDKRAQLDVKKTVGESDVQHADDDRQLLSFKTIE